MIQLVLTFALLATLATTVQAKVTIVRVDPLQETLALNEEQLDQFLAAYQDYSKKRKSAIRRARLKARGSDDATRRVNKALKKVNKSFDEKIHAILEEDQFTQFLAARETVVGQLSDRRAGFSDASIPNPGGLLAEPGVYGVTN